MGRRSRRRRKDRRKSIPVEHVEPETGPSVKLVSSKIEPRRMQNMSMMAIYSLSIGFGLLLMGSVIGNQILTGFGLMVFIPGILLSKGVQEVRKEQEERNDKSNNI